MHPNLKRCFSCGQYANILFLVFALLAWLYYWSIDRHNVTIIPLEIAAYTVEVGGFVFMLFSLLNFHRIVRHRYLMKTAMLVYIIVEAIIMIIDFNYSRFTFWHANAMWLNIAHSIFSGAICFTYLALEPRNTGLEVAIIITEVIILAGMFGVVFHLPIYVTLLCNALAYVVFFSIVRFLVAQERIMIDCHGDRAKETKYRSDFFDDM
ncbi:MAG: hypothetical protein J5851_08160 [Oscillospiraceae bacterium]|nr:hypothetical protein [Oscillospiraceae bacterium]